MPRHHTTPKQATALAISLICLLDCFLQKKIKPTFPQEALAKKTQVGIGVISIRYIIVDTLDL